MNKTQTLASSGFLSARKITPARPPLAWYLRNWLRWKALKSLIGVFFIAPIARKFGICTVYGKLAIKHFKASGGVVDYGVVGFRVVTTAFVNFVVDQLQTETSVFGDFKYHDSGVGTTAENASDTAIETTDGESRATGTQTEDDADDYRSVGTISYTTTKAITEHGLFNDASAGTLMDRTVFTVINVVNGDSIQFTYTINFPAGS